MSDGSSFSRSRGSISTRASNNKYCRYRSSSELWSKIGAPESALLMDDIGAKTGRWKAQNWSPTRVRRGKAYPSFALADQFGMLGPNLQRLGKRVVLDVRQVGISPREVLVVVFRRKELRQRFELRHDLFLLSLLCLQVGDLGFRLL